LKGAIIPEKKKIVLPKEKVAYNEKMALSPVLSST
jgi:hypothetical protein